MFVLLRNLADVQITTHLPYSTDFTIESDLARLGFYRKQILHSQHKISNTDFKIFWDTITGAIIRLSEGNLKDECESLLKESSSGADEKGNITKQRQCDVCDFKNIKASSVVWCLNCDESLCQHCLDHHFSHKLSRYHECIKIEDYYKDPSMSTITCSEHKQQFDFFCEGHHIPICGVCVMNDHNFCQLIKPIQIAIKQSDETKHELYEKAAKLLQNVDVITKDVQGNLKSYEIEKGKVRGQLRSRLKAAAEEAEKLCLKEISHNENLANILFKKFVEASKRNQTTFEKLEYK